jgi:hypothetical protein
MLGLSAVLVAAILSHSVAAEAQTTTRTIVVSRTSSGGFATPGWATRNFGRFSTVTMVRQTIQTDVSARAVQSGVVPVDQLPVVAGIRRTPVAPPTVYRIEGPQTAMQRADEERMRQVNPGARVITPDDLSVSPQIRSRDAIPRRGHAAELGRRSVAASGVMVPQVIIVRPSGAY